MRRALRPGSRRWAVGAGLVLTATAYTAYYYVVYLAFFLAVYLIAWRGLAPVRWIDASADAGGAADPASDLVGDRDRCSAAIAVWIVVTGGRHADAGPASCGLGARRRTR